MHNKLLIFIGAIFAVLLAACSSNPNPQDVSQPSSEPEQVEVKISDFTFKPETVTVSVGTVVNWNNADGATHTATSDAGDWDSGNLNTGSSFTFVFDQAGIFTYHCEIHPGMLGTIEVTQ